MTHSYPTIFHQEEDGSWSCLIRNPFAYGLGETKEAAEASLGKCLEDVLAFMKEEGLPIPPQA
jgi:predicted RNase H-like HicB family nuclease